MSILFMAALASRPRPHPRRSGWKPNISTVFAVIAGRWASRRSRDGGHWALSGPGWAAEWNQGGESGFLSIACGADDDKAVATKTLEIPSTANTSSGSLRRLAGEDRALQIRPNRPARSRGGTVRREGGVEEDNEMKPTGAGPSPGTSARRI